MNIVKRSYCVNATIFAVAMGLLAWQAWLGGDLALALEHSPLAWLQTMMLIACANTAFNLALFKIEQRLFWYLLSFALLFCTLDEKFMFHEHAQVFIYSHFLLPGAQAAFLVHMITGLYAISGCICLVLIRTRVVKITYFIIAGAVLIGCSAVLLDITFDNVKIQAYEEVLEYLAETLFLIALVNELYSHQTLRYLKHP